MPPAASAASISIGSSDTSVAVPQPGLRGVVPFRFECHRCARCCSAGAGYVWVEDDELERLAQALGMTTEAFVAHHVRSVLDPRDGRARLSLREAPGESSGDRGGRCALLVGHNECSVYDARPSHCRAFPYWDSVLQDRAAFENARATCPGIAVVVDGSVRERAHAELAALYASLEPAPARSTCCLAPCPTAPTAQDGDEVFATGLEADFALERGAPSATCELGPGAPLACRAAGDPERFAAVLARVRSIERECGYPAAYGRLRDLLESRGRAARLRSARTASPEVRS